MSDKFDKAVKDAASSANKKAARRVSEQRTKLNVRPHFVPINIGGLDILEYTLSEYIKFPDDVAEKVLQDLIAATEKKIQNMPEYKIKDDKTKSNWQNAQQKIDRYYKDEVEPLKRRQNLRTFKDITNAFIKFAKDKHKGRMIWKSGQNIQTRWLGADGTPLVLNKPDGSTDVSLFINTTPAIVYKNSVSDSNIIGIMYSSYNAAGSGIFTPFFNNILGKSPGSGFPSIFQITDDYVKKIAAAQEKTEDFIRTNLGIDIGHLAGTSQAIRTALQQKFSDLIDYVNTSLASGKITEEKAGEYIDVINSLNSQLLNDPEVTYGKRVQQALDIEVGLEIALNEVNALIVVPQERYENQYFFGTLKEAFLERQLPDELVNKRLSPSLLDHVTNLIKSTILTGRSNPVAAKRAKLKFQVPKVNLSSTGLNITAGSREKKIATNNLPNITTGSSTKPRAVTEKPVELPISPVNIANLINLSLAEVIKSNMGSGNRKDILNLRSGRFAETVQVENVTEGRRGAITAFYSYMRNPYATFSRGGKQQYPRTRDPKLLISKSIREIAQQLKIQQLRAVEL